MTATAIQPSTVEPISPAQEKTLADAEHAAKRFAFAPKLALFNGVSLLLAAALSLFLALFDAGIMLSAVILGACGWVELAYGKKLRAYDPRASRYLVWNQLALLAVIVVYAALQLKAAVTGDLSLAKELERHPELMAVLAAVDDPQIADALDAMSELFRFGVILAYSVLIGVSLLVQGGAAYYYWSRGRYLTQFLASTPGWVVDWMRRSR